MSGEDESKSEGGMQKKRRFKNGICHELNGWLYVSVSGNPKERGYTYGYLVAGEMKKIFEMLNFLVYEESGNKWQYLIDLSTKYLKPTIKKDFAEFYEEMEAFAEGCSAGGTKTTVDEIVAWNNYFSLTGYFREDAGSSDAAPKAHEGGGYKGSGGLDRCSAFIANGDFTADGKIVMAHNDFANFTDGQYGRVVLDIKPDKGNRFLMQGAVGWIWSGSDFFVTDKGIMGTETTMGGFTQFENNHPISCRMRNLMQYAKSLDDCEKMLLEKNSGDYACSWLFGDINTNEIMSLELGLKYHNTEKTKNGYFIGFNAPFDPRIRNLECSNTGFDDIRRHQGSRRVRLADLMDQHKGKINIEVAKIIIADHYDVYLKKDNPCSRTVCSHYELDAREYMSQADRPKPFQPRGALNGKVCDSTSAKNMTFIGRNGTSCGRPFMKDKFCKEHREWAYLQPYLHDRPRQPWTRLTIRENYGKNYIRNRKTRRPRKGQAKNKTIRENETVEEDVNAITQETMDEPILKEEKVAEPMQEAATDSLSEKNK